MNERSRLPASVELHGRTVTPLDMRVVAVRDDGTRVVRVWMAWGDEVVHRDVEFDRATWIAHGGADGDGEGGADD